MEESSAAQEWLQEHSFGRRESGESDLFAHCVPSSVQVVAVFATGRRVDRVVRSRAMLEGNVLCVGSAVRAVCADMPEYKFVTTGTFATMGGEGKKVEHVSPSAEVAWPETLYGIGSIDALVVVARKRPRLCMTRRNMVGLQKSGRKTRRMPSFATN
jgi:hypothetical protein